MERIEIRRSKGNLNWYEEKKARAKLAIKGTVPPDEYFI
jgi:hypothetical protein